MARRLECAAIIMVALVVAAPAHGETTLACKGQGTITNRHQYYGADQSVVVDVDFTLKFDEAARTLSARVPNVDYLRRIRLTNGEAVADEVSFSDQEITAKFPYKKAGVLAGILTIGMSALMPTKIPPLVIDRLTGAFIWGPHSGQCSPVTLETTKKF